MPHSDLFILVPMKVLCNKLFGLRFTDITSESQPELWDPKVAWHTPGTCVDPMVAWHTPGTCVDPKVAWHTPGTCVLL